MSIDKVIGQMERYLAGPESRLEVMKEVAADRLARTAEFEAMKEQNKAAAAERPRAEIDHEKRMREGYYGRLD